MQMKWMPVLALLTVFSSNAAHAFSASEDAQNAYQAIQKYTQSVACGVEISPQRLYPIEVGPEKSTYYAWWTGDVGCAGGNRTIDNYVSEINRFSDKKFVVKQEPFALGSIEKIDTRFITAIKQVDANTFHVISSDFTYEAELSDYFPDAQYQYTFKNNQGQWKMVQKRFLKNN